MGLEVVTGIGRLQRQILASTLEKVNFFSVQVDGSCDSANLEEELFSYCFVLVMGKFMFAKISFCTAAY